ncbi:putative cellulase [Aspergillus floccosus]
MFILVFAILLQHVFALSTPKYVDWRTYQANGVNLGGWLCQESTIDTQWWANYSMGAADEWNLCAKQGSNCGPILERRYATFITHADIDKLASAGVNTLRIPTTYAAWIKMPGSQLYSGRQIEHLDNIATYAITKYNMHVIVDVHGLPGGVNGMDIGEAFGHYGWFHNHTALEYSLKAIDAVLAYVQGPGRPESYTIAPINEPADTEDMSVFGTPAALSADGAAWVVKYIRAVLDKVAAANPRIPVMFQGSFHPETYWSRHFSKHSNLVFDVHKYYFEGRGATGQNITSYICADAEDIVGDGKFPIYVGEWSIQAESNNSFAGREKALNTGLYVFAKHTQGSSYWTAKFFSNATVDGQGTKGDYWNYMTWIEKDMIHPEQAADVCI